MSNGLYDLYPPKELWPEFVLPLDQVQMPEELNLAEELVEKHIRNGRGEDIAVYYQKQRITFNALHEAVNRLGNSLLSLGVEPGECVGVKLVNQPEALILNFAILKIGAVPVLFSRLWSKKEDMHVIRTARIKVFLLSRSLFEEILKDPESAKYAERIVVVEEGDEPYERDGTSSYLRLVQKGSKNLKAVKVRRDSTGLIMFTSGTTGLPKGCIHSVGGILSQGYLSNKYVYNLGEGDVITGASAAAFAAGYCIFMVLPFCGQGAVSLIPKFKADDVLKTIQEHKATVLTGVPASYRRLLTTKTLISMT